MVADVALGKILPAVILLILTGSLTIIFLVKRKRTNVTALDWMIGVFSGLALMGTLQLFKLYYGAEWAFFKYASDSHSLPVDPVRFVHLIVLLLLYFMSEQFLGEGFNNIRLVFITFVLSIYIGLSVLFVQTGDIIQLNDVFGGLQPITLDSILFDIFQLFTAVMLFYVYFEQHRVSDNKQIEKFLKILIVALGFFVIASILEVAEAFISAFDVDGFLSAIPAILLISAFYIKYPNFVYLAPSRVKFLQIVSTRGELLYAAEFKDEFDTSDFLIAPSLTSVNALLGELVGEKNLKVEQFKYNTGHIIFEQIGDIQVILQTDRAAGILKRSMRYFLRVFTREFQSQIDNFVGYVTVNDKNISPDDVLRQCVPIVQSKALSSSYRTSTTDTSKDEA